MPCNAVVQQRIQIERDLNCMQNNQMAIKLLKGTLQNIGVPVEGDYSSPNMISLALDHDARSITISRNTIIIGDCSKADTQKIKEAVEQVASVIQQLALAAQIGQLAQIENQTWSDTGALVMEVNL